MKKLDIAELNKIYDLGEEVDKEVFAEMRSNVLLMAGEHYKKDTGPSSQRAPGSSASDTVKLRLVKNHAHKVVRHYTTQTLAYAGSVSILPQNETDLQDVKDSELNSSVWEQAKTDYRMKEKIRSYALSFNGVGEVCVKLFWDPNAGDLVGYEQKVDEKTGEPLFEDSGDPMVPPQPVADESKPVFKGAFCFEEVFAANLLREPCKKNMRDHGAWIIRKMVPTKDLKEKYKNDPDKLRGITESEREEFVVFDAAKSSYQKTKGESLVREFYWDKCTEYPEGYFVIATSTAILEEGPLPFGIFPICWAGFDEFPTSPRGRGILKVARPYIAEVNRASSAMAMHQVTIGDDKIIYQSGTKLAPGSLLPGVRGITYQGREPQILPGRNGGQYLDYINAQIGELYSVLMIDEQQQEKAGQTQDPLALLYRSASQKVKFSLYVEKFEQFIVDLVTTYLEMAKHYLPDDALIPAIGMREYINVAEFRKTTPLRYQIKVEPRDDTLDTMLGKQIWTQNVLQYVGKELNREDIGKLMQAMPYGGFKEAFEDFTIADENAKNDMLALERGEYPPISKYDDPAKMGAKLTNRMRRPDYKFLPPQVQALYEQRVAEYADLEAKNQQALLQAEAEYIPSDGTLVACDLYLPDPKNPENQARRARIPQKSLEWLVQKLEAQGASLDRLEQMSQGAQLDVLRQMQMQMMNGQMPGGAVVPPPAAMPGGMPPVQQMAM